MTPREMSSRGGRVDRRSFLVGSTVVLASLLAGCAGDRGPAPVERRPDANGLPGNDGRWSMPPEEAAHEATWMCWPSSRAVWGRELAAVQDVIARIAVAIARFEPVTMLARPAEVDRVRGLLADADARVVAAPVDDLWARDTLPSFLLANEPADDAPLAAGRVRFNGWGGKQIHAGDALLAGHVADLLGIPLVDSGLTGEGGGLENDGEGTILAARSSWINANRNPGVPEAEIGARLAALLGADRVIWVDGIAGADITDGHIDTLARFAGPDLIVLGRPAYAEPGEPWFDVSRSTRQELAGARTADGRPYRFASLVEPASPRGTGEEFLSSYVNYYVCNGAVVAPSFGDGDADEAAAVLLAELYPDREIVQIDIDAVAAGGGGIHCATQQQPRVDVA